MDYSWVNAYIDLDQIDCLKQSSENLLGLLGYNLRVLVSLEQLKAVLPFNKNTKLPPLCIPASPTNLHTACL